MGRGIRCCAGAFGTREVPGMYVGHKRGVPTNLLRVSEQETPTDRCLESDSTEHRDQSRTPQEPCRCQLQGRSAGCRLAISATALTVRPTSWIQIRGRSTDDRRTKVFRPQATGTRRTQTPTIPAPGRPHFRIQRCAHRSREPRACSFARGFKYSGPVHTGGSTPQGACVMPYVAESGGRATCRD